MKFYPKKISERFYAPKNAGKTENANVAGTSATFLCGTALRFYLQINIETKQIAAARFQTSGCGYLIAAADVLAEKIVGKKLIELRGSGENALQTMIEIELGEFPAHRKHCLKLCSETLQNAFAAFRAFQIEEFTGEKALVCTCFGVTEDTIESLVKENSLETIEQVTDVCSAGGGCGSCQPLIQEILDIYQIENR